MDNRKILILNRYHVFFLVQNIMIGLGLLTLAYDVSPVGYAAWVVPIMLGILLTPVIIANLKLLSRFPEKDVFAINRTVLGKRLGSFLNLVFTLYCFLVVAKTTYGFARVIQSLSFPNKSIGFPIIATLFCVFLVASYGVKSVARFCIIAFFLTIGLLYFLRWSFMGATWSHLFPLFNFGIREVIASLHKGFLSLLGFEGILFYYPFIRQKEKALKDTLLGFWLTISIYTLVCLASVVIFTIWQLQNLETPVLNIFQLAELSFIERLESFGLNIWIFLIVSTASFYLWAAARGMKSLLGQKTIQSKHLFVYSLLLGGLLLLPIPTKIIEQTMDTTVHFGFFLIVFPFIMIGLAYFRKKGGSL